MSTSAAAPEPQPPGQDPAAVIAGLDVGLRRGYRTTEFWLAIATLVLPVLTLIFHRDLSNLAVPLATLAAGAANGAYAISRAITKAGHAGSLASATKAATTVDPQALAAWTATMVAAVQAISTALAVPPPAEHPSAPSEADSETDSISTSSPRL